MKIIKELFDECCSTSPYLGAANSAAIVQWDIPIDAIEGKTYKITMRAINPDGYIATLTFPIKIPRTKLIKTKVVNNELIVTDKNSTLYGMKMKRHKGEDISKLKIRTVHYRDVWKKNVKYRAANDRVEKLVFIIDNMPNKLNIKTPKSLNTYAKRAELKV